MMGSYNYLVGGFNFNHLEKYEFVSWDDEIPNMMGKIKFMFQTTNQISFYTAAKQLFFIIHYRLDRPSDTTCSLSCD